MPLLAPPRATSPAAEILQCIDDPNTSCGHLYIMAYLHGPLACAGGISSNGIALPLVPPACV